MFEVVDGQGPEKSVSSSDPSDDAVEIKEKISNLVQHCAQYQGSDNRKALFQLTNTAVPFFIVCAAMVYSFSSAYWLTALLTIPASLLLVRLFIIQHDCGHNSFFSSRKWNNYVGRLISVLTWTPYDFWRRTHNLHHASSGNLDNRGFGAIETITIKEYRALPPNLQFWYRLYRNPYIMLLLGTPFFIIIGQRFASVKPFPFCKVKQAITVNQVWKSVFGLNTALILFYGGLGLTLGFDFVLLTYLPVVIGTAWIGGWLFFIQHQFEEAHWDYQEQWDYQEAAVMGSSYYDLHPILQWFTGNIGLHHIHHLNSKVPNYKLQECIDANEELKKINRITLWESFKYANLALWDEDKRKMITFAQLA